MCFSKIQSIGIMDDSKVLRSKESIGNFDNDFKYVELVRRLEHPTPARKRLMLKYLMQKDGDSEKILSEYFGVALAFVALGIVLRKTNETHVESRDRKRFERMAFEAMLKGAMERLREMALHAQDLEEKVRETTVLHDGLLKDKDALQAEKLKISEKRTESEAEVLEMKNKMTGVVKTNEEDVAVLASKEQDWRNEKKSLIQEIDFLKRDGEMLRTELQFLTREEKQTCEECDKKKEALSELHEMLEEREFLMMASVEDAKIQQQERHELSMKIAIADMISEDLRLKLAEEVDKHRLDCIKYESMLTEKRLQIQEAECQVKGLRNELELLKKIASQNSKNKSQNDALLEKISREVLKLREDLEDREKMMAAMLAKNLAVMEERYELATDLALIKTNVKTLEIEKERWKQLAGGKECGKDQRKSFILQQSIGKGLDNSMNLVVDMESFHAEELKNIRSLHNGQVEALQNQIDLYQRRVAELQETILVYLTDGERWLWIQDDSTRDKGEQSGSWYESGLMGPIEAGIAAKEISATKKPFVQYMDTECMEGCGVDKWERLYFAAQKILTMIEKEYIEKDGTLQPKVTPERRLARMTYNSKLEQMYYWQEIDVFERQMRAKDERMEAFRQHLVTMELESQKRQSEIDFLKRKLAKVHEEKVNSETLPKVKGKELTVDIQRSISYELQHCYVDNVSLNTSDQNHVKEIVVDVMETEPFITKGVQNLDASLESYFDDSCNKKDIQLEAKDVKIARTCTFELMGSGGASGSKSDFEPDNYSAGHFMENPSPADCGMNNRSTDVPCLNVERLSDIPAEAEERILHRRQPREVFGQVAKISRPHQVSEKRKSLHLAIKEDDRKFSKYKAGQFSEREIGMVKGEANFRDHKGSEVDADFGIRSVSFSNDRSHEKRVSWSNYDINAQSRDELTGATSHFLSLGLKDTPKQPGNISAAYVRTVEDKRSLAKAAPKLQLIRGDKSTTGNSTKLEALKRQVFG